jgi:hypothetical protein
MTLIRTIVLMTKKHTGERRSGLHMYTNGYTI